MDSHRSLPPGGPSLFQPAWPERDEKRNAVGLAAGGHHFHIMVDDSKDLFESENPILWARSEMIGSAIDQIRSWFSTGGGSGFCRRQISKYRILNTDLAATEGQHRCKKVHSKKYLTAEHAEIAEIILNFLSQRAQRAPR
jgi:hypothetical protein